jgi:nicotinamidase-related amidase
LAVQGARSLAPLINELLALPGFVLRISTQDFHPIDHISFASNHPGPNNRAFESFIMMQNPAPGKERETKQQQLWPVHCVADTAGAAIIPEIEAEKIDLHVKKGMDKRVEMYSAFADAFGNNDCVTTNGVNVDLAAALAERNVSDVFVVGVAGDYCVKCTAVDAAERGFKTWVIEEGTKCVVPGSGWEKAKAEMEDHGVKIIAVASSVLARVRAQG